MNDLDDLLTPVSPSPEAPDRREDLWRQTAGTQRRRRWAGRARLAVVLAAVYGAGAATVAWRTRLVQRVEQGIVSVPRPDEAAPKEQLPPVDTENDPYRNDPPQLIERWAALADGRRRVELYRRAGDLYCERFGDHAAAIRCYRHALDGGTAADLVVKADQDNWLLMSLKVARLKERRDVRN
ncbi:MAG TPA: hypothetical protein VL371_12440 [Gemmataceae bacterium]|jgi:hypothetical protein|nr:hypothetical protein [Gemmataceae bacterium]